MQKAIQATSFKKRTDKESREERKDDVSVQAAQIDFEGRTGRPVHKMVGLI